jgi:DNA-binding phage protein
MTAWARSFNTDQVKRRLRALIDIRGMTEAARTLGVARQTLYDTLQAESVGDVVARAVLKHTYGCEFERCDTRWRRV